MNIMNLYFLGAGWRTKDTLSLRYFSSGDVSIPNSSTNPFLKSTGNLNIHTFPFAEKWKLYIVDFPYVIDGDTVVVKDKHTKKKMKIRLNYIDAPEKSQDIGQNATQFLRNIINDFYVNRKKYAVLSVHVYGKDRYNRYLGELYINRANLNVFLVQIGYAWCYKAGCPAAYKTVLFKAKKLKLGLWAKKNPTAPWIYRWKKRRNRRTENNWEF